MQLSYYGEIPCQGKYKSGKKQGLPCQNKAYFYLDLDGPYLCGVHNKKEGGASLPKNPHKKQEQEETYQRDHNTCQLVADANIQVGRRGQVKVDRLMIRKAIPRLEGYVNIFPNYRHGNRKDGYGFPSLSPMSLGPVKHNYFGFPLAKNLENFHQGAKVFPGEVDANGNVTSIAIDVRKQMYEDATPYRHKFKVPYYVGEVPTSNKNIPLFAVHYNQNGEEVRYNYLDSRYFYCYWYTQLASRHPDLDLLNQVLDHGFNLLILGYDGYPVEEGDLAEILWEHYCNTKRPFGHELVLYSLLVLSPGEYPWNRYYQQYPEIYAGVIAGP